VKGCAGERRLTRHRTGHHPGVSDTTTGTWRRIYRGPSTAGAPRLTALPGVHREVPETQQVLEVERYDTDDHRLAAGRITLAIHRGDGPAHWRLVLPDGAGTEQLRVPAPDGHDDLPPELDELVRGARRDRPLRPVARVRTVRNGTRLLGADGRLLALVLHDQVTVATLGRATEVASWTEVELRRAGADPGLLEAVEERLVEDGLSRAEPGADAELDRLLGVRPVRRRRPRAGKKGSAGAALLHYVAKQVDRIAAEDLRVRRDEPDAVHQLRVASRRLRSALKAYRPLLDRTVTDPLTDELRHLGRALAPARDAEVLCERITDGLAALDPELRLGPVQAQVSRHFGRVEAEARAAVLTELDSERYAALRAALEDLLDHPPLTAKAARPARKELPRLARRSARRLEEAVTAATAPDGTTGERDEAMHSARKAGKRLRYATEVALPAVGRPAKKFASNLKGLQQALGEHQDTVVARGALRELGAQAHAAGENGFSFGVLLGLDAARAGTVENDLPELWTGAWARKRRAWLR
jgi:CHAD domain-containing protein